MPLAFLVWSVDQPVTDNSPGHANPPLPHRSDLIGPIPKTVTVVHMLPLDIGLDMAISIGTPTTKTLFFPAYWTRNTSVSVTLGGGAGLKRWIWMILLIAELTHPPG